MRGMPRHARGPDAVSTDSFADGSQRAAAKGWRDEDEAKFAASSEGNWLLRALAEESGGRLVEIAPGCFIESTLDPPAPPPV